MKITPANFELMRRWFACVVPEVFPAAISNPEIDPTVHLEKLAATSPSNARRGLLMAIGDMIEATDCWSITRVTEIDRMLDRAGLPSLSEVRAKFSKVLRRVITRGSITSEAEYYAVRNAAEMTNHDERALWELLTAYEAQRSK